MARPIEFDTAKARDKALLLHWKKEFRATSLPDQLAAMDTSRSSFYAAFGCRRALFVVCLDLFAERTQRVLLTARAEKTPLEALEFHFERHLSRPARGRASLGCMLVNTVLELAGVDDDASDRASRHLADTGVVVANHGLELLPVFFGEMTKLAWSHSCWGEAGRRRTGAQAIEPDPSTPDRRRHLTDTVAHLRTPDERLADLPSYPWPARCLDELPSLRGAAHALLGRGPRLAPVIGQSATAGGPATTSNADPGRRRSSARPRPETARSQRG